MYRFNYEDSLYILAWTIASDTTAYSIGKIWKDLSKDCFVSMMAASVGLMDSIGSKCALFKLTNFP